MGRDDDATRALKELPERVPWNGSAVMAGALCSRVALRQGQSDAALEHANRAVSAIAQSRSWAVDTDSARLAQAEALRSCGRREEATAAIQALRDRLLGIAATAPDAARRERFLRHRPGAERTLELAELWARG
jgi:hypothetical protein